MDDADEGGTDGNGNAKVKKLKSELQPLSVIPSGGTVDEYKQKYGMHSLFFWEPRIILHQPKVPVKLYPLIEETMKQLNKIYIPYAYIWVKTKRRDDWQELKEIEESINVAVEGDNEEYLKEALRIYYEKWVSIIKEFKPIKDTYIPF